MKYAVLLIFMMCNGVKMTAMEEKEKEKNLVKPWFINLSRDMVRKKKKEENLLRKRPISSELIINPEKISDITASNNTQDIIISHKQIVNNNNQI